MHSAQVDELVRPYKTFVHSDIMVALIVKADRDFDPFLYNFF